MPLVAGRILHSSGGDENVVEVQHVTKRYGSLTAVDDISFTVERGEILGFLGPNGAGKTTTMRILTGYLPATEGQAQVAGFDVFDQPLEAKRRTGYLPETPPLYPEMTIEEYLRFVARINGVPSSERRRQISTAMERTNIADMADRFCGKLSKGYRQRVGLAQALLHNPDVLILDEPTAGLDPRQIIETRKLIAELAGDHTIILSTHILPEVAQTCEQVVIINKGRVVAEDTPANLTGRLHGSETIQLQVDTGSTDPTSIISAVPGVVQIRVSAVTPNNDRSIEIQAAEGADIRREIANTVVRDGWGLLEMRPIRLSLEEIFLQLTTTEEEDDKSREAAQPMAEQGSDQAEQAEATDE